MKIAECKIGQIVEYNSYCVPGTHTRLSDRGTIIALDLCPNQTSDVGVGIITTNNTLQIGEKTATEMKIKFGKNNVHPNAENFQFISWIKSKQLTLVEDIGNKISSSIAKDGCVCSWCANYFPMAIPNQSDGTLKCYSCRDSNRIGKII